MTTTPPRTDSRPSWRWLFVLGASILLHLFFIGRATELIRLPSLPTPASDIVTATLLKPPPPPKPKPAAKPKPKRNRPPQPVPPKVAPPEEMPVIATTPALAAPETVASTNEAGASAENPEEDEQADRHYSIDLPPSAELKYDVQKTSAESQPTYGSGTITWHADGDRYSVDGDFGVLFITALRFKSVGTIGDTGIAPELYSEKRFRRAETNTHFHHERNTISFSASTKVYPRNGSEQDRASIIWQLAGIGRGDSGQFVPGALLELVVAGTRDAEPWQIRIVDREEIDVDGQTLDAWHVVRAPRAGSYDQKLDIWLAPQLQWYPVRLRYTEQNGDYLDMTLTGLNVSAVP